MDSKEPVNKMSSEEYKKDFVAEYTQLKERRDALADLVYSYQHGISETKPECSIMVLREQLSHMNGYLAALEIRSRMEKIELK